MFFWEVRDAEIGRLWQQIHEKRAAKEKIDSEIRDIEKRIERLHRMRCDGTIEERNDP